MTLEQRDELLAEPRIAVLGIGRESAGPLLAPIWFRYESDTGFVFCLGGSSAKGKRLRAEGRATVCVHADDAPYRYVIAEGPVTLTPLGEGTRAAVERMAIPYLGERGGTRYAEQFKTPDEVLVTLTPERWQSLIVDGR
jgi:PPOX class probable F420-dependent enzyme